MPRTFNALAGSASRYQKKSCWRSRYLRYKLRSITKWRRLTSRLEPSGKTLEKSNAAGIGLGLTMPELSGLTI